MNRIDLALAMNAATDDDLRYVAEIMKYTNSAKQRRKFPIRAATAIAAAAVLLLATLGVAMAANEQVRDAVFSFFHISSPEQVPQPSAMPTAEGEAAWIGRREIDDAVVIDDYLLQTPIRPLKGSVSLWDADGMRFYTLTDQGLFAVPGEHREFTLSFGGAEQAIAYDFAKTESGVLLNWVEDPRVNENPYGYGWNLVQPALSSEQVWLELPDWNRSFQMYPMLLDLESGELTDIFKGLDTDLAPADAMTTWYYSPNLRYALLRDLDQGAWLYDLQSRTVTDLSNLANVWIQDATFTPQNHLLLSMTDGETYTFLSYDPETGTSHTHQYPASHDGSPGVISVLSHRRQAPFSHALIQSGSGGCALLDLETNDTLDLPEDLNAYLPNIQENAAGNRLLCTQEQWISNPDGTTYLALSRLAICDLENHSLVELDREQYETAQEFACFWLDDNRFVVWANSGVDGTTSLHVYTIQPPESRG